MKITSFNPMIITSKADDAIELLKELGFDQNHHKEGIDQGKVESTNLKDPNGFKVDVASAPTPQDIMAIRINVDDFDEAVEFFKAKGFKAPREEAECTGSSMSLFMYAPSGYAINICKHIK